MGLKGKQPDEIQKRLKMFMYGAAGVGKTMAAISFPNCYLIDTERGAENKQYVELIKENNGAIFQTSSFDEIINEIKSLMTEKHHYKTLIIDPLTTIYNELLDQAAAKGSDATAFGRHYQEANKSMKRLLQLLMRLDMSIVITSHAKNEYGQNMSLIGQTFDCYKKLDYLFDLVIEIQKLGKVRTGIVKKTRIATFAEFEEFPFSYDVIADKYGKDILEKESVNEVLATSGQVLELYRLLDLMKVPNETVDKWLTKANADSFEEMSSDLIQKCIESLQSKIGNK